MRFAVLGAGGWGTAVARLLANAGHETTLWARDPKKAEAIGATRVNAKYLPDVTLPRERLTVTSRIEDALDADALFLAVPSFAVDDLLQRIAPLVEAPTLINLAKGLDRATRQTVSERVEARLPGAKPFALSGPSHAEEVGRDYPTAVVLAGKDCDLGATLQRAIATPRFRVYLSEDVRGVELCAAVKNVIALATGISDGIGYGDNSRGALITRGLAEMMRLGERMGAEALTLSGLSGLGDLVLTCTSELSRNRTLGFRIGQGERLNEITSETPMVAEGVRTSSAVVRLAARLGVEVPISAQVHMILHEGKTPQAAVRALMGRELKAEQPPAASPPG